MLGVDGCGYGSVKCVRKILHASHVDVEKSLVSWCRHELRETKQCPKEQTINGAGVVGSEPVQELVRVPNVTLGRRSKTDQFFANIISQ